MANAKTLTDLRTEADDIREEKNEGANTASRVGTMFRDIIDYLETLNTSSDSEDEGGSGGGGGGGVSLNEPLFSINNDLSRTPSRENQVLVYQNGVWDYGDYGGGSTPTSGVTWDALASEDATKQIHLSHLTTALNSCSFWGRHPVNGVVSGDMTNVGSITMRNSNDNTITFKIEVDDNGNLKFNGNIYATGGVSALGNSGSGGGGGGGSTVSWTKIVDSGTKIATITIDGESTDVFAPTSGGGGGATALEGLSDVILVGSPSNGEYLKHNGSNWENAAFGPVITDLNKIPERSYTGLYILSATNGRWSLTDYSQSSSGISSVNVSEAGGNAVTSASVSGTTLTLTKGTTFLTSIPVASTSTLGGFKTGSNTGLTLSNTGVLSLATSGVPSGTYTKVTVDQYGRVTAGANPTTLAGYGITDAVNNNTTWWGRRISSNTVTGSMDSVGTITMSGYIYMNNNTGIGIKDSKGTPGWLTVLGFNSSNALYIGYSTRKYGYQTDIQGGKITFATNNGVKDGTEESRLEVGEFTSTGLFYVKQGTQGIRIGDGVIKWNSSNNSLYVERAADAGGGAANFYASGGVSALGFSGGGSPSISSATIGTLNSTRINFAGHAGTWSITASYPGDHEQLDFSYGGGGSGDRIVTFPNTRTKNTWADKYFIGSSSSLYVKKVNGVNKLYFYNGSSEIQIA